MDYIPILLSLPLLPTSPPLYQLKYIINVGWHRSTIAKKFAILAFYKFRCQHLFVP